MDLEQRVARAESRLWWQRWAILALAIVASALALALVGVHLHHVEQFEQREHSDRDSRYLQIEREALVLSNQKLAKLLPMVRGGLGSRLHPYAARRPIQSKVVLVEKLWNRMKVEVGGDDSVWPGDAFGVFREEKLLGTLVAFEVGHDWMYGYFVPGAETKNYPQAGDTVASPPSIEESPARGSWR